MIDAQRNVGERNAGFERRARSGSCSWGLGGRFAMECEVGNKGEVADQLQYSSISMGCKSYLHPFQLLDSE